MQQVAAALHRLPRTLRPTQPVSLRQRPREAATAAVAANAAGHSCDSTGECQQLVRQLLQLWWHVLLPLLHLLLGRQLACSGRHSAPTAAAAQHGCQPDVHSGDDTASSTTMLHTAALSLLLLALALLVIFA